MLLLDVHVFDRGPCRGGADYPFPQVGPDCLGLGVQAWQVICELSPDRSVALAAPHHAVSALGLDRAQVHELKVNAIGVPVLLVLHFGGVRAQLFKLGAQLSDRMRRVARD